MFSSNTGLQAGSASRSVCRERRPRKFTLAKFAIRSMTQVACSVTYVAWAKEEEEEGNEMLIRLRLHAGRD